MSKLLEKEKFGFYRYKGDDGLYVAVPKQFCNVIAAAAERYGGMSSVPSMKTVRGIFARRQGDGYSYVDRNMQENDVTINQLEMVESG
jgi:hypothetical protein